MSLNAKHSYPRHVHEGASRPNEGPVIDVCKVATCAATHLVGMFPYVLVTVRDFNCVVSVVSDVGVNFP